MTPPSTVTPQPFLRSNFISQQVSQRAPVFTSRALAHAPHRTIDLEEELEQSESLELAPEFIDPSPVTRHHAHPLRRACSVDEGDWPHRSLGSALCCRNVLLTPTPLPPSFPTSGEARLLFSSASCVRYSLHTHTLTYSNIRIMRTLNTLARHARGITCNNVRSNAQHTNTQSHKM